MRAKIYGGKLMKSMLKFKRLAFISLFVFICVSSGAIVNEARSCCGVALPAPQITLEVGGKEGELEAELPLCPFGVNKPLGNLTVYYNLPPSGIYAGLPTQLRLAHNSLDLSTGPLGRGWRHNYNTRLTGVDSVPIRANLFADNLPVSWWVSIWGTIDGRWFWRSWSGVGEIIDITWDGMVYTWPHWRLERLPDGNYTFSISAWAPGRATAWITGTARLGTPVLVRADGRRDVFTPALDGTFIPEPGVFDTLIRNPDGTFTLTKKDRTRYLFSPAGILLSITDRNNNTTTFTYDGAGNLVTITDPEGNTTSYTYAAFARIASISENGILRHSFAYDTTLRVTRISDALGNETIYTYQPAYRRTTVTSPLGHTRVYTYDERNNITSKTDPLRNTTTFVYDRDNNLISQTDPLRRTTTFTYDLRGNRTSITDPLGNRTIFVYDRDNNLIRQTDPLGRTTTFTYDERGNLLGITDPLGNRTTKTYDTRGMLLAATDARGNTTTLTYDFFSNLISITDPLGNTTTFGYDLVGRKASMTDARGNATRYTYDGIDNLIRRTYPDGTATSFEYDRHLRARVIDANNNTISYTYDANDRLIKVTDALGNITRYTYDRVGNKTSITDANGNVTTYTYDANNQLIKVISPLGHIRTFTYDAVGNRIATTDANRATTIYTYDKLNRLIRKLYPDGTKVSFTFDAVGNRRTMTDIHGTTTYLYDALNRLIKITDPAGRTINYEYDPNGNRIRMTTPEGVTTYTYDKNNRLIRLTNPQEETTTFTYDAVGNRVRVDYANNTYTTYIYNNRNWLVGLINHSPDGIISSYTYTYDRVGNRVKAKETDPDEELFIVEYLYDSLYQLTGEVRRDEDGEIIFAQSFTYDRVGNRLRKERIKNDDKIITEYHYNEENQLITKITNGEITTFTYDANGNQVSKTKNNETTTFEFDFENRLTRITFPDDSTLEYTYDGIGRRIQSIEDDEITRFFYDGRQVIIEYDKFHNIIKATYTRHTGYGGGIGGIISVAQWDNEEPETFWYHYDGINVRQLTDDEGEVEEEYLYDAFGNILAKDDAIINPYRFSTKEYSQKSGLIFFGARYYDPEIGRFITRGAITQIYEKPATIHPYVYCLNNPVNLIDLGGLGGIEEEEKGHWWLWQLALEVSSPLKRS
jgi:RHS repeat-associated protein